MGIVGVRVFTSRKKGNSHHKLLQKVLVLLAFVGWPLYLRLENNYISRVRLRWKHCASLKGKLPASLHMPQEAIQEKIDSGLIQVFTKQDGPKRSGIPEVGMCGTKFLIIL